MALIMKEYIPDVFAQMLHMSAVPPFGASVSYLAWHYVKDDEQLSIRVGELQTVFVQTGVGMELARHMGTVTAKLERAQGPIGPLDAAQADTIDGPLGRQSKSGERETKNAL